ncbi:type I-E CRISPR-associated protein Cas7/Cse4/CasC [Anaerococcus provencensis]|uniref:type I-E CRISPR-associated protein Cas7/Cse4/CasC n=1 Tax=Anaerococcus provencensis TaxID=938293 RepID=UPI00031118B8|nr:type I-E CRISPR-associated protein Cas7/Cse4/CasC [Anaerococcus provencensis]
MSDNRLFLDVHAIQTLPPSNINRDDTGSPKTCQYGGVKRSRVSSQSWKRAMRTYFYEQSEQENVGVRTKDIVQFVANKIIEIDSSKTDEAFDLAEKIINAAGVKTKDGKAKALFFLGDSQARQLAKAAIDNNNDKKYLKEILKDNPAIDIALFGRMVADDPSLNEDASSQVAHAISTHSVDTEFDFFTAVDDLAPEENAGAGMLGTVEFNSSTLYRYANVAIHELYKQLENEEAVINTAKLFVKSFANSLPTGKVNTFANQTLPQFVMVSIRDDRPVNLVSAFEDPIKSNDGYVEKSTRALVNEYQKVQKIVNKPLKTFVLDINDFNISANDIKNENSLNDLIENLASFIDTEITKW